MMLTSREQEELAQSERRALLGFTGLSEEELHWVRLDQEPFPDVDLADWDGIILCGSRYDSSAPQETKSERQITIESALDELYGRMLEEDFPFLGLCYGMGTLNSYMGGLVDGTYSEDISAPELTVTEAGKTDPLLAGIDESFHGYVGHHEAVTELAPGLTPLVSGTEAPIQMVRARNNVYATQFHPELDLDGICLRIDIFADAGYYPPSERADVEARVQGVDTSNAHKVLRNFADTYKGRRNSADP